MQLLLQVYPWEYQHSYWPMAPSSEIENEYKKEKRNIVIRTCTELPTILIFDVENVGERICRLNFQYSPRAERSPRTCDGFLRRRSGKYYKEQYSMPMMDSLRIKTCINSKYCHWLILSLWWNPSIKISLKYRIAGNFRGVQFLRFHGWFMNREISTFVHRCKGTIVCICENWTTKCYKIAHPQKLNPSKFPAIR